MASAVVPEGLIRPSSVDPDAIMRVLRVPNESAGMRLDVFLMSRLKRTSRTRARAIVEQSAYSPTGRRLSPSARVRAGDFVVLWRAPFEDDAVQPPLPVVYEDAHLLVIDKPPLIAVHPTARYHRHTVKKRLEVERPGEFLALIHRIDRETSGLLMLARTPESERAFKAMLEQRSTESRGDADDDGDSGDSSAFEKEYLAIVHGVPESGLIELPLELDPENSLRVKMRVAQAGTGLHARTGVRVLEQRGVGPGSQPSHDPGCDKAYALVACQLHTGRQHQIRIHLAARGTPLVGDKLYGPDERLLARAADDELTPEDLLRLELPRHALHAHRYRLHHAVTGEALEVVSPLPPDLDEFWTNLAQ